MMTDPVPHPQAQGLAAPAPAVLKEETEVHTRILRVALAVEESRAYWTHAGEGPQGGDRALRAFEERWFGGKSLERVRFLMATLAERYEAYPNALAVLHRWRAMDVPTRQAVCHWHLQLSDPLYRRFTGAFLVQRRELRDPRVDRGAVLRWVKAEVPNRWSEATCVQFASKLLSAASEAGLVSPKRDPRSVLFPKVPDIAIAYLLHLLREVTFEGTLTDNPYLRSVGLDDGVLDQRLRALPELGYRRMAHLVEFEWAHRDLATWAEASL